MTGCLKYVPVSKDSSDVKGSYWRVDRDLLAAGDREKNPLRCRR